MKKVYTEKAPKAVGPYSQGMISNGMVFVSGQIPFNPETMQAPASIEEQTKQSLENVKAILEAASSNLEKVIKVSIFIKNMDDFAKINEVYSTYFSNHKPARACVEVARLPKDVKIEIEAIAEI